MLNKLKIRSKMLLAFGLVIGLMVISVAMSIVSLQQISTNMNIITDSELPLVEELWKTRRTMVAVERELYKAASTEDTQLMGEYVTLAETQAAALLSEHLPKIQGLYSDKETVKAVTKLIEDCVPVQERVFSLLRAGQHVQGLKLLQEEYTPTFNKANEQLVAISDALALEIKEFDRKAMANTVGATWLLLGLGVVAVALALGISYKLTKSIVRPVQEIEFAAKEMAAGNLTHIPIAYESGDELGIVCQLMRETVKTLGAYMTDLQWGLGEIANGNFNISPNVDFQGDFIALKDSVVKIIVSLSETMGQINLAADQVAGGSQQVSDGAQALSQGATEQASSVQELSATISEISDQVKKNAQNAQSARTGTETAGSYVMQSNKQMEQMIAAMNDISDKSSEIGKIIKTIDDIAFQTNILALNAAVEAARAGSAGKGFAVVADEVRNLAGKSAAAASDTAVLIEEAIAAVNRGTQMAGDTAKAMNQVVEAAKGVTVMVEEIAKATDEQASSISQVTMGVEQISCVVQTNSATAEESAAASEELSSQAAMLKGLVSNFQLMGAPAADAGHELPHSNAADESFGRIGHSYTGSKY